MKLLNKIVFVINIIALLALLCSYLAAYISPALSWMVAFLGLAFPAIFLFNLILFLYWAVQLKWAAFYSLAGILIGWGNIPYFFQLGTAKTDDFKNTLNIVDFNTKGFGAYDGVKYDTSVFFNELRELRPDIMCFQEFVNNSTDIDMPMFRKLFKEYKSYYKYNVQDDEQRPSGYSISIFSRYPILNADFLERINPGGNCTIFTDIKFGDDTIRIVTTHLKSIAFEKQDYETVEEIEENDDETQVRWFNFKHIAYKLKRAFIKRAQQAETIRRELDKCKYKIILCGDFNDSPASYSYNIIKGDMKDAFAESGSGFSSTYIGKMPSFRIDYILCDKNFEVYNYKPHNLNFSDHRMISATIKVK